MCVCGGGGGGGGLTKANSTLQYATCVKCMAEG